MWNSLRSYLTLISSISKQFDDVNTIHKPNLLINRTLRPNFNTLIYQNFRKTKKITLLYYTKLYLSVQKSSFEIGKHSLNSTWMCKITKKKNGLNNNNWKILYSTGDKIKIEITFRVPFAPDKSKNVLILKSICLPF